jgi:hypothetical protein
MSNLLGDLDGFIPENAPRFDSYLSIGDITYHNLTYNGENYNSTLISYYSGMITTTNSTGPSFSTSTVDTNSINAISSEIRDLISDISSQYTELNQDVNTTRQVTERALDSIEKSESMAGRAYVVGMIGIGTGIAGIILAVLLKRKEV